MQISMCSDFGLVNAEIETVLKVIADAGFTHVHWSHKGWTDFIYADVEIEQVGKWLDESGLKMPDMHGSDGIEKRWYSEKEYERQAGVELVINRLEMTARLGGDAVVMHTPKSPITDSLKRSLDEIEPHSKRLGVKIAVENGYFDFLESIFKLYSPDYVGLCYDSGHANMADHGVDRLEEFKDRLHVIHLHDNDGIGDQHKIPFSGTIDWLKIMDTIATSSYNKCITLEVSMGNMGIEDPNEFARLSYEKGAVLVKMLESARENAKQK